MKSLSPEEGAKRTFQEIQAGLKAKQAQQQPPEQAGSDAATEGPAVPAPGRPYIGKTPARIHGEANPGLPQPKLTPEQYRAAAIEQYKAQRIREERERQNFVGRHHAPKMELTPDQPAGGKPQSQLQQPAPKQEPVQLEPVPKPVDPRHNPDLDDFFSAPSPDLKPKPVTPQAARQNDVLDDAWNAPSWLPKSQAAFPEKYQIPKQAPTSPATPVAQSQSPPQLLPDQIWAQKRAEIEAAEASGNQPAKSKADVDPLAALRSAMPEREPGEDDLGDDVVSLPSAQVKRPARSYGHEHRALREQARQAGHDPDVIQQGADNILEEHNRQAQEHNEMLRLARQVASEHGNAQRRGKDGYFANAEDPSNIRYFDEVTKIVRNQHPEYFKPETGENGSHLDQLHAMLTAGNRPLLSPAQAFKQAWDQYEDERYQQLAEQQSGKSSPPRSQIDSLDDDFIPFGSDPDVDGDLFYTLAALPEDADFIWLNNDGWERYTGPRHGLGWRNVTTGRIVYTQSPTAPGFQRRQQQASQQRARELGNQMASHLRGHAGSKPLTEAEINELATHIQSLPVHSLKSLKSLLMGTWGNPRRRQHMVEAMQSHVKGLVGKRRAAMYMPSAAQYTQPGLFDQVDEQPQAEVVPQAAEQTQPTVDTSSPAPATAKATKHPVEYMESWDFAHPEDREFLQRVYDKHAKTDIPGLKAAADKAYAMSGWRANRGVNERRFLASAQLLNEMAYEGRDKSPSAVSGGPVGEQPQTPAGGDVPAAPSAPPPQPDVYQESSIRGGNVGGNTQQLREQEELHAKAAQINNPGFSAASLGRGSPNHGAPVVQTETKAPESAPQDPKPASQEPAAAPEAVTKTTQDLLPTADWKSLNVGQYRHGGSASPADSKQLADVYGQLDDRERTLFAEQFGIENAARALPETRDELVNRKIKELEFKHGKDAPDLNTRGGLFGERGVGESAGLFDDVEKEPASGPETSPAMPASLPNSVPNSSETPVPERREESAAADTPKHDPLYHPDGQETEHHVPGSPEHLGQSLIDAAAKLNSDDPKEEAAGAKLMDELMGKINALPHEQRKVAMLHAFGDGRDDDEDEDGPPKKRRSPRGERKGKSLKAEVEKEGYTPDTRSDEEYEAAIEENKRKGQEGIKKMAEREAERQAKKSAASQPVASPTVDKPASEPVAANEPAVDPYADLISRLREGYYAQMADNPNEYERAAMRAYGAAEKEFEALPEEHKGRVHMEAFQQEYKPKPPKPIPMPSAAHRTEEPKSSNANPIASHIAKYGVKGSMNSQQDADNAERAAGDVIRQLQGLDKVALLKVLDEAGVDGHRPTDSQSSLLQRAFNRMTATARAYNRAQV